MQACRGAAQLPTASSRQTATPLRSSSSSSSSSRARRGGVVTRCSSGSSTSSGEDPAASLKPSTYSAQRVFDLLGAADAAASPAKVGAEWGQGFTHFYADGPLRVDVDALNDQMRPAGALRLRHAQHPHEQYGMVFSFDGVVADLATIRREAWVQLAAKLELRLPDGVLHHPELQLMSPEVAVVRLLRWASDRKAAVALAIQHAELAGELLATHNRAQPGVREWLHTLGRFNVPCALVSSLDRTTVQAALARMGLHDHFSALVTAEDEVETIAQRLLTASIKLHRAPNMCVYFDSSPQGVTAAHNCTLKAVAVQGAYRPHQLHAADITCSSLSALSVINLRRMWANAGSEHMDLQKQRSHKQDDDDDGNKRRRRRIANALL